MQSTRPTKTAKDPLLSQSGLAIVLAIGRYHFLSFLQLKRLLGWSSESYLYTWLDKLVLAGYVRKDNWIADKPTGRPTLFWSISEKGRLALHLEAVNYPNRISHTHRSALTLKHLRDLNDLLILFDLLVKFDPSFELLNFRHDQELQRFPFRLDLPDGRKVSFVPDGFIALRQRVGERERILGICPELDRGTEEEAKWREKIRCYVAFYRSGAYQEAFGVEPILVPVVVKLERGHPEIRMANLIRWTEKELTDQRAATWGKSFRFTILDAGSTPPSEFLGGLHWRQPFTTEPSPLLEGVA